MKLTFKTLKQEEFSLEADPSLTILEVKGLIQAQRNHDVACQKLIFAGKVLEDDKKVSELSLSETDFIVLFISPKPAGLAKAAPSKAPAAAQPAQSTTTAAPAQQAVSPAPAPAQPKAQVPAASTTTPSAPATAETQSTGPSSYVAAASQVAVGPELEQMIERLMEMGFPRDQVVRALRLSYNNPDRAAELLFSGSIEDIPEPRASAAQPQGSAPVAAAPAAGNLFNMAQQQQQQQQSGALDFLRSPQFNSLRQALQQNPAMLSQILHQLAQTNPQILQRITQNQDDFIRLLNEPIEPEQHEGELAVTVEQKEAIERLIGLGFDSDRVIQAYFACDKDENLAANYLLEHADDQDLDDMQ